MPGYKNRFSSSQYYDHVFADNEGAKIGTLRVKPNGILWKPAGQQKFFKVSLDKFRDWIMSTAANAGKVRQ